MKKILLILVLFYSGFVAAQTPPGHIKLNSRINWISGAFDSSLYTPVRDTNWTPSRIGAMTIRPQDSIQYVYNGVTVSGAKWIRIGNGVSVDSIYRNGDSIRWVKSNRIQNFLDQNFFNSSLRATANVAHSFAGNRSLLLDSLNSMTIRNTNNSTMWFVAKNPNDSSYIRITRGGTGSGFIDIVSTKNVIGGGAVYASLATSASTLQAAMSARGAFQGSFLFVDTLSAQMVSGDLTNLLVQSYLKFTKDSAVLRVPNSLYLPGLTRNSSGNLKVLMYDTTTGGNGRVWYYDALSGTVPSTRTITVFGTTYDLSADRDFGFGGAVPSTRTLSINGVTYDLTANRSWTVTSPSPDSTFYTANGTVTYARRINANKFPITFDSAALFRIRDTAVSYTGKLYGSINDFNQGVDFLVYDSLVTSNITSNTLSGIRLGVNDFNNLDTNNYINIKANGLFFKGRMNWLGTTYNAATTVRMIVQDTVTGDIYRQAMPFYTVNNGLTASTPFNFQLGGTLLDSRTINTAGFSTTWTGSNTGDVINATTFSTGTALKAISASGVGLDASTTSGTGLQSLSTSGLAAKFTVNPSSVSTVVPVMQILRTSSGTAADGIGGSLDFYTQTNNGTTVISNQLISKWTAATTATRTSQIDFIGIASAATQTFMNIQTGGIVRVNNNADTLSTKSYVRSELNAGFAATAFTFDNTNIGDTLFTVPVAGTLRWKSLLTSNRLRNITTDSTITQTVNVINLGTGGSASTDYLARDSTWKTIPAGGGGSPDSTLFTTKGRVFLMIDSSFTATTQFVRTTGTQTIAGVKTFSSFPAFSSATNRRIPFISSGGVLKDTVDFRFENGKLVIPDGDPLAGTPTLGMSFAGDPTTGISRVTTNFIFTSNNVFSLVLSDGTKEQRLPSDYKIGFSSATTNLSSTDVALARIAAGGLEINNGTAGVFADLKLKKLTATVASGYSYNINGSLGTNDFTTRGREDSIHATMGGTTLAHGTYTPSLTHVQNIIGSTAYVCQYLRVGNTVTVSGRIDIDPDVTVTITYIDMSLPIASAFTASTQAAGTIGSDGLNESGTIKAESTNDRVQITLFPTSVASRNCYFTYTYQVL